MYKLQLWKKKNKLKKKKKTKKKKKQNKKTKNKNPPTLLQNIPAFQSQRDFIYLREEGAALAPECMAGKEQVGTVAFSGKKTAHVMDNRIYMWISSR